MTADPRPTSPRTHYDQPETKRGARLMMGEAGVKSIAHGAFGYFAAAFALRLGATTFQMGLFSATTELAVALSQLGAAYLVGPMGGRKRMVVSAALVSAVPWLFMALVPVVPEPLRIWALIPLAGLSIGLLSLGYPVWGSWISDLVPVHRRGRYMGLRGSVFTLVTMAVSMGGAALLDLLHGVVMWGFVTIFLIAMTSRLLSAVMLWRTTDPRPDLELLPGVAPWKQFAQMGQSKLGRFNFFILVFHFTVGMAGPFVSVYFLRELGISYTTFVGLGVAASAASIVTRPFWGRLADSRGNMLVLTISALAMSAWPFLLTVSAEMWYLWTVRIVAGASIAGWGIASTNFVLERSAEETRPSSVGFHNGMSSAGIVGGALVGGAIAAHLPTIFAYQMLTLFFLSGVLRLSCVLVFLPMVHEPGDRYLEGRPSLLAVQSAIGRGATALWHHITPFGKTH